MSLPIAVRPEAEEDLDAACEWYDLQADGLGKRFILTADAFFERISTPISAERNAMTISGVKPRFFRGLALSFGIAFFAFLTHGRSVSRQPVLGRHPGQCAFSLEKHWGSRGSRAGG
ncbi:MAG: hypothetical protein HYX68_12425, partial [Planctomycetes bacterium]|nr:hypothetical protein [Planctomycetota bacterium]